MRAPISACTPWGLPSSSDLLGKSSPLNRGARSITCYAAIWRSGLTKIDREELHRHGCVTVFDDEIADFADTAAIITMLDLVVSVDTSVAHIAGALGRPMWVLLPFSADYRWLIDREDSPWYPSARLLRQPQVGDWGSVLERLQRELLRFTGMGYSDVGRSSAKVRNAGAVAT